MNTEEFKAQLMLELATAYPEGPNGEISEEARAAIEAVKAATPEQLSAIVKEITGGK